MSKPNPFSNNIIIMPSEIPQETKNPLEATEDTIHKNILAKLDPIDSYKREDNIARVNDLQDKKLTANNVTLIQGGSEHPYHRKLVAYYRPTQLDYVSRMQVLEIMRFLRYYVEHGYSTLFDEFAVLYRFPENDILDEFAKNSYAATGLDFRVLSSIYANTVHFSNGTPDFIPGTIPILGTTPHSRWKKSREQHVHLPLEYQAVEKIGHKHGIATPSEIKKAQEQTNPKRLIPVLNIALSTIQKTEQVMLQMIQD